MSDLWLWCAVRKLLLGVVVGVALSFPLGEVAARELSSYAFVNDDGTLRIRKRTVHLYGIYIPPTGKTCEDSVRPVRCAPRAALALDFIIGSHFVHCAVREEKTDGSVVAFCEADGEDLAAYLLQHGWAAALPGAPPEYAILERIARARSQGVWGFPVDRIVR